MIRFGFPWPRPPFPTRMCAIRLAGDLFLHSPTPLAPALAGEIAALGAPRWIVGPNRIHYWWIPKWKAAYPGAEVWLAPRVAEQAGDRIALGWLRWLMRAGGVIAPHGRTPLDLAPTFSWRHRRRLREAVETMIACGPARAVIAHGHRFERDGAAALARAFGWLLN